MKTLEQIQEDIEEIEVTKDKLKNTPMPESEKIEMMEDLDKILEKLKKEKREMMFHGDWSEMCWRPKEEGKYIIRILHKKHNLEGPWYLQVHRHYVNLKGYRSNRYVCNKNMFDQRCAICEIRRKLYKEGNFKAYKRFDSFNQYAMNILVRGRKEAEGVKIWEAPASVLNSIFIKQDSNRRAIYDYDLIIHYDPEETRNRRRYRVNTRRKESSIGTEEQKQLWLSQMLELTAESLYKPADDINEPVLLDWAKTCVRTKEHLAWYYSGEGQAEMEAVREEKEAAREEEKHKRVEEEQARIEQKKYFEELRKKIRKELLSGELSWSEFWEYHLGDFFSSKETEELGKEVEEQKKKKG